jgi:hypothetical protein
LSRLVIPCTCGEYPTSIEATGSQFSVPGSQFPVTIIAPAILILIVLALMLTGALIARALPVAWRASDPIERWFEYALIGALLNGWLAFTLAQIGIFSAPLHVAVVAVLCIIATLIRRSFGGQHSINVPPSTSDGPPSTPDVQRSTLNVQPATCNPQPATPDVQRSTFNVQPATPDVPRSTFHVPPATRNQRPTFNVQRSTFNVQRSTFNVQPATPDGPRSTFHVPPATRNQRPTFNVQRSTFNVQRSTFNVQPATPDGPRSTFHVQPATPDGPRSTFHVQPATPDGPRSTFHVPPATRNQRPTFNVQRSTFNVQRSTFNVQPSTFNVQPSTFNVQPSTFNLQPSTFNLPRPTFNLQRPTFNLLLSAILLLFVFLVTPPFETIIGVRDAGVYANAGFIMARTGSLTFTDPLVAQIAADQQSPDPSLADAARQAETNVLGVQNAQRFIATRLRAAGFFIDQGDLERGRVVPQGLHLFSAWIGLLAAFFGMHGGLLAPAVTGLLGVWSVALLGRRIAGSWVGLLAALFLALNAVQVWFSRYSTAETTAQFLIFAGLYAFARAFGSSTFNVQRSTPNLQPSTLNVERSTPNVPLSASNVQRSTFNVQPSTFNVQPSTFNVPPSTNVQPSTFNVPPSTNVQPSTFNLQPSTFNLQRSTFNLQPSTFNLQPSTFHALLAGLAFGQLALTRIEFFLVVGPLALYLIFIWLARRWTPPHTALLAGAGAMLLHAGLQIVLLARAYFFDTLFARLQDFALTAALALPFLTPTLRQIYLLRPCSRLTMQPCPPIAGMPPTTDAPLNWTRIGAELLVVVLIIIALIAVRRLNLVARLVSLLVQLSRPLRLIAAVVVIVLGGYTYLIRPQILSPATIAALPACLTPAQLTSPQGACLTLQGYVGAPIATPAYVDPLVGWVDQLISMARGRSTPPREACIALRRETLPPSADGRTMPEVIRDGLIRESDVAPEILAALRACDRYVLRDLFGVAQANLVRLGWYLSPLGIALALAGLALMVYRINSTSWLFLVIAAVASVVFLRLTYGTSDQHYIYIMRRYVPHVYPAFAIGIAYAIVHLTLDLRLFADMLRSIARKAHRNASTGLQRPTTFNVQGSTAFNVQGSMFKVPPSTPDAQPSTSNLQPSTFNLQPPTPNPQPSTFNPQPSIPNLQPSNVQPSTFNPQPSTPNLQPSTPNLQPSTPNLQPPTFNLRVLLTLALVLFLVVTGRPIYRHTEYAGAITQIGAMAAQLDPGAIVLMRGGAPSYAQARDIPDLLATPLTFGFGVDAFALKSRDPGRYAPQLSRYIRHWHEQGRPVYLAISASGALTLPGWRLEPVGRFLLDLPEYEQPTDHKPSAVQRFTLDFALYRLTPGAAAETPPVILPDDYAYQVRGVYRAERINDRLIAWTDGDALFRLPAPKDEPLSISVTLASGARPTALTGETCLALAAEPGFSVEEAEQAVFTTPVCVTPGTEPTTVTLAIDPRQMPSSPTGHLLLRVRSPAFIPARDDPASHDPRRLGVQIVGLGVRRAAPPTQAETVPPPTRQRSTPSYGQDLKGRGRPSSLLTDDVQPSVRLFSCKAP